MAVVKLVLDGDPGLKEGLTSGLEGPVEGSQELEGTVGQNDCLSPWGDIGEDFDTLDSHCTQDEIDVE